MRPHQMRIRPYLNASQDRWMEYVEACVDFVGYKLLRLLDESIDLRGALLTNDHAVL